MVSGQCHQCAVGFNTRLESDHDGLDFARRICMATCSVVVVLVGVPSACLWDYCRVAALHMFVQRRQLFVQVCLECCPPESDNYPTQVSCFTACSATSSCVISSATVSTSSWCFSRGQRRVLCHQDCWILLPRIMHLYKKEFVEMLGLQRSPRRHRPSSAVSVHDFDRWNEFVKFKYIRVSTIRAGFGFCFGGNQTMILAFTGQSVDIKYMWVIQQCAS